MSDQQTDGATAPSQCLCLTSLFQRLSQCLELQTGGVESWGSLVRFHTVQCISGIQLLLQSSAPGCYTTTGWQNGLVTWTRFHGACLPIHFQCRKASGLMVLDTDKLHFSEEFLEFPAQADMDICADALRFSAWYRAEESRQEFCADSCGKWWKPLVSWSCLWSWASFVTASKIYVYIRI